MNLIKFARFLSLSTLIVFLSACGTSDPDPRPNNNGGTLDPDAGLEDADTDADPDNGKDTDNGGGDADTDTDPGPDADTGGRDADADDTDPDPDPGEVLPGDPPRITARGDDGLLLRGIVLTPDGVLNPGEVLVEDDIITCVDEDCSAEMAGGSFTIVETDGVISPGLIDAHNHLAYNFLPPWIPDPAASYSNREQWQEDLAYKAHVAPYADKRNSGERFCPAAKWGELRSLIHATTTMQGQSFAQRCMSGGIRNADLTYHHLGYQHMATNIASPRDITTSKAEEYIERFEREHNPVTRLAVHMQEGYEGDYITDEFESFAGRDPRTNVQRHQGVSLLDWGTAVLIHSLALTPPQILEVYDTDSMIVWSPSSNLALYGVTAPIDQYLEANITLGIGPDWTVSGAFDLLEEMRVAYQYGRDQEIDLLTPKRIWEMATWEGAIVVGLHEHIGRLEPGMKADLAIFRRAADDPYLAVIESRAANVELVLIDGKALYGAQELEEIARDELCEDFEACGAQKFLCVKDRDLPDHRGDESLDDIRGQLIDILTEYDRPDGLLDLVICGI